MTVLFIVFILHLASASFNYVAYSRKTGHITMLGQHNPRVLLTNDKGDIFLICGFNIEEAGCTEINYSNEFNSDIQTIYTIMPDANIPFACYSKLHKSHLLPLCAIGNMTIKHDKRKRKLELTVLNVKPISVQDKYSSRFWISLCVIFLSTILVLVWLGERN